MVPRTACPREHPHALRSTSPIDLDPDRGVRSLKFTSAAPRSVSGPGLVLDRRQGPRLSPESVASRRPHCRRTNRRGLPETTEFPRPVTHRWASRRFERLAPLALRADYRRVTPRWDAGHPRGCNSRAAIVPGTRFSPAARSSRYCVSVPSRRTLRRMLSQSGGSISHRSAPDPTFRIADPTPPTWTGHHKSYSTGAGVCRRFPAFRHDVRRTSTPRGASSAVVIDIEPYRSRCVRFFGEANLRRPLPIGVARARLYLRHSKRLYRRSSLPADGPMWASLAHERASSNVHRSQRSASGFVIRRLPTGKIS